MLVAIGVHDDIPLLGEVGRLHQASILNPSRWVNVLYRLLFLLSYL